jgi:hypothetical protein
MINAMITCPKTGRAVPTGIVFGSLAAFDGTTLKDNTVQCAACGEPHLVDDTTVKVFPSEPERKSG